MKSSHHWKQWEFSQKPSLFFLKTSDFLLFFLIFVVLYLCRFVSANGFHIFCYKFSLFHICVLSNRSAGDLNASDAVVFQLDELLLASVFYLWLSVSVSTASHWQMSDSFNSVHHLTLISSERHRSYYTESSFFWKLFEQSCLALLSSFWHKHGRNTHSTHFKEILQLLRMFLLIYWPPLQVPLRSSGTEGARRYFLSILRYIFSGISCEATCTGFLLWLIFPTISVKFSYHNKWEGKPL